MKQVFIIAALIGLVGCGKVAAPPEGEELLTRTKVRSAEVEWITGPQEGSDNSLWIRTFDPERATRTFESADDLAVKIVMSCCRTPSEWSMKEERPGEYKLSGVKLWTAGSEPGKFDMTVSLKIDGQWVTKVETQVSTH